MEKLLLGLLFVALGAIVVYIAVSSLIRTWRFVGAAWHATGEVVAMRECRGNYRHSTYAPVVRFTPLGGRPMEFTDEVSSNPPGYRVGDQVHVLYLPADPESARIHSITRFYLHDVIFAAGGSIFALIGSVLILAFALA